MEKKEFSSDVTLFTIFVRFLSGFGAGLVGTIVLGIILFLSWSIVGETLSQTEVTRSQFGVTLNDQETHPLFMGIVLVAVFLASLVSNLIYCLLATTLEEKYQNPSTNLTHIFSGNLVILLLFLPIYMVASSYHGSTGTGIIAISHVVISAMFSFLVLEILSKSTYIFISLYGIITGITLFMFLESFISNNSTIILCFSVLPFILASLGAGNGITEMFYGWLQKTYGVDFLNSNRRFGSDYGRKEKPIDTIMEEL